MNELDYLDLSISFHGGLTQMYELFIKPEAPLMRHMLKGSDEATRVLLEFIT